MGSQVISKSDCVRVYEGAVFWHDYYKDFPQSCDVLFSSNDAQSEELSLIYEWILDKDNRAPNLPFDTNLKFISLPGELQQIFCRTEMAKIYSIHPQNFLFSCLWMIWVSWLDCYLDQRGSTAYYTNSLPHMCHQKICAKARTYYDIHIHFPTTYYNFFFGMETSRFLDQCIFAGSGVTSCRSELRENLVIQATQLHIMSPPNLRFASVLDHLQETCQGYDRLRGDHLRGVSN